MLSGYLIAKDLCEALQKTSIKKIALTRTVSSYRHYILMQVSQLTDLKEVTSALGDVKSDYLDKASELICLAVQKEKEQDYQAAFSYYRNGVDLLLGVHLNPSPTRREAVKKKTAEYLMRAEQISSQHLRSNMGQGSTQTAVSGREVSLALFLCIRGGQFCDFYFDSSDCGRTKRTIMPHSVPHMVQLRKFIVSEDTVFLLLQYAEGKTHTAISSSLFRLLYLRLSFPFLHLMSLPLVSRPSLCPCSRQMLMEQSGAQADSGSLLDLDGESSRVVSNTGGGEFDKEVSRLFAELDELSLAASQARIPEEFVQCWAVEMVTALDSLHQEGIICRDLNPNNILLDYQGHVQITYFCSWSDVEESCDKEAVANMYCAPGEIHTHHTTVFVFFSYLLILYLLFRNLILGMFSLLRCHPAGIGRHTALNIPESVSEEARSLLEQLLQYNPMERLGAGVGGVDDIKSHPFFARVNWPK
uniref:Ribosomal protein S6 kinase polypeptide 1 n=1 Tax=Seriola lalandi dorsalis TaxID=1841481 RepID=A0A3B4WTX5_SERLL